jgi:DNA polymerase-1
MPEPLSQQIEPIREITNLLGFTAVVAEGGEADDCIASLAERFKTERPVVIVGSDKDLRQCLDSGVVMWDPGLKADKITTLESFIEETGLHPSIWPDYQALIGDSSDNIPGVPGVGPKTAQKLMADHPHLEDVRDDLENLKPAVRKKIEPHVDDMFVYRELTRLRHEYCADYKLKDFKCREPDADKVIEFLDNYEFSSLVRELHRALDERARHVLPEEKAQGKAASATAGHTQLGLWSEEEAPEVKAEQVASADAIEGVEDSEAGLVVSDDGFFIGTPKGEYGFRGASGELAGRLTAARRIFAPDVKALIASGEAWERIETAKWFDLGLGAYLLSPEDRNYSWQRLRDVLARDMVENPVGGEGTVARALGAELVHRLKTAGMYDLMFKVELPLIPVLARMEKRGVALDLTAFDQFLDEVRKHLEELEQKIYELAGQEFNLRSSRQLADVLFEELGLKPLGKTPGGSPSTSVSVLERLRGKHEIVEYILKYRTFEKLRSTYLEPLPRQVDEDGRVHTTFNQLATATGRLSSSGPNLQNIPIRGEFGPRMRACFTAGPGNRLVAADYSQIELRVLAHLSGESTLVEAFRKGEDIHSRTAALLFEKDGDASQVTQDERRMAKTINFGLIYGMGPQKLSRELSIPMKEAKEFIARYFERLSELAEFYDRIEKGARDYGYVTTITGRRRLLPDIHSASKQEQALARRQAINTRVQGSAADIIKMAMIKAEHDDTLRGLGAGLILQVHDELLLEAPDKNADAAGDRLAEIMTGVIELDVPLSVDHGVGRTWADAH